MNLGRATFWANPTAWYTTAGVLLLAFSLWLPWLSASRTTRIELRAERLSAALLDATSGMPMPPSGLDLAVVEARFVLLAASRGIYVSDLERITPTPPGALLCMTNKHYAIRLAASAPDPNLSIGNDTSPALEVVAWPLRRVGPGHCAFFFPDDAARAYTRNLRAGYVGFDADDRPVPGACHRRPGHGSRRELEYPGNDNERWILF